MVEFGIKRQDDAFYLVVWPDPTDEPMLFNTHNLTHVAYIKIAHVLDTRAYKITLNYYGGRKERYIVSNESFGDFVAIARAFKPLKERVKWP